MTPYLNLEPTAERPAVVLVAGIPGTGKSTLAEALARHLRRPLFSMDWTLGSLVLARETPDSSLKRVLDALGR